MPLISQLLVLAIFEKYIGDGQNIRIGAKLTKTKAAVHKRARLAGGSLKV